MVTANPSVLTPDDIARIADDIAPLTEEEQARLSNLISLDARRHHLTEPEPEPIRGIWDDEIQIFAKYRVSLRFTSKVMAGIPSRADVIEGWLRTRIGVTDEEELRSAVTQTLKDLGRDVPLNATYEELVEASKQVASDKHGNMFKRDPVKGLYLEGRQAKAMLKEATAICFPWDNGKNKWRGKTPRSALAEWVFCEEDRIYLGRSEADGTHLQVGQVSGPSGKRSTLTHYEFCDRPIITLNLFSYQDLVSIEQWQILLVYAQHGGLGALRSQSFGMFKVIEFEKLEDATTIDEIVNGTNGSTAQKAKATVRKVKAA